MVHYALHAPNNFPTEAVPGTIGGGLLPRLLLASVVGVLIVVFDADALFPFMKLCLYLLRYLLTVAYFRLHEIHSTLIITLPLVCVRNNSTLVAAS